MLKIYKDKVIIEGHEQTKEQCETMTLLANALKDSEDFKVVEYKNGYAEFEKIGATNELKNGDVLTLTDGGGDASRIKVNCTLVINGTTYNNFSDTTLDLSNTDINITYTVGSGFAPYAGFTINYSE